MKTIYLLLSFLFLSILSWGQTILNQGDLVILGIDANLNVTPSTQDEISFACFKDITTGTEIQITDQGYKRCYSGLWGSGEGGAKLTRTGATIPAGTVITFRTAQTASPYIVFTYPDANWSIANLGTTGAPANMFNLNSGGDQIYFAQGGVWTSGATCSNSYPGTTGRMLFAFSTSNPAWDSTFANSTQKSALYPGMSCYNMAPTGGASDYVKYTGPLTAATQKDWISRIGTVTNWTKLATTTYIGTSPNLHTTVLPIIPGTDADWTSPGIFCQSSAPINLNSYLSSTSITGGTWSGTGVSGNTFNPSGLSGTYNITYTVDCPCCISQTHTITINASPTATIGSNTPQCSGNAITLTSGGGTSYSWSGPNSFSSTSQNPSINNAPAAASGTYTVTVTASGCTSTASVLVKINQRPNINAGQDTTIPSGTSTIIHSTLSGGTGPYIYSWSPSDSLVSSTVQNPHTINLYTTTAFTVTVTDQSTGCTGTDQMLINITGVPIYVNSLTVSPSSICTGGSTQIVATATGGSGNYTYSWTPATSLNNATIYNPVATPANTTIYTVFVYDGFNTAIAKDTITVFPLPTPTATSNSAICEGQPLNLSSLPSGATSYSWSGPNSFSNSSQNPSIANATPAASGNYIVTVTDLNGCSATAHTVVNINLNPIATAWSDSVLCQGATLNLTSGGGSSYSWSGPNGFTNTLQYPIIPNVPLLATGVYTVTVTNANGCSSIAQTSTTINANPIATASSNIPCDGSTLNLTSGGGSSYNWSGPNGFADTIQYPTIPNITPSAAGIYTVVVTNANGCSSTAQTTVTINANPIATASSNTPCEGASLNLTSGGGTAYSWSGPNNFSNTTQNPAITNVAISAGGTYTVTVTNANGCSSTAQTTATVNANPTATASSNTPCAGATLNLTSGGGSSYSWSGPNSFSSTTQNPTIANAAISAGGSYTVTVTDAKGCSDTKNINVIIHSLPLITLSIPNNAYCLTANAATLTGTPAGGTFSGTGVTDSIFNPSQAGIGTYNLIYYYTDANSCFNSDTISVSVHAVPTVNLQSDPLVLTPIYTGETVTITAAPTNYSNYNFYVGSNSVQSGSSNTYQSVTFLNGDHVIVIATDDGCTASDTLVLDINPLPNAFIPNGPDEKNNLFLKGIDLQIINRWGQQLYSGKDGWDGTYNGQTVSPGTYFYIIKLTDLNKNEKTIKGAVTVVAKK